MENTVCKNKTQSFGIECIFEKLTCYTKYLPHFPEKNTGFAQKHWIPVTLEMRKKHLTCQFYRQEM